ncbi:MAG: hypothetical protein DWQ07_25170 [Chloroflexi bacterium]|nr:MAG: hypothetical protein DWQ07_25170 [Chloroflexota bacterium]MBL1196173.1 hypothetical protein [Chloroflexota bacterium]NOH13466.1 hypothetical protein [Chloroflexota bacterium]
MSLQDYFANPKHLAEKGELPLLSNLIERYHEERPFDGLDVVFGHVLVRNSLVMLEALVAGGANPIIAHIMPTPADEPVLAELTRANIPVLTPTEAVQHSDVYIDVNAALGRQQVPSFAAEVTRTGIHHYQDIDTTIISADNSKAKNIEGFFGTGDGFVRAWKLLRPDDSLEGKRLTQFGYGKIGRGLAFIARTASAQVSVVDTDVAKRQRATEDGFTAVDGTPNPDLQGILAQTDIVVLVTGIPAFLSEALPPDWMRANQPTLVNLGAEDEFGPAYADEEIMGGREIPLNFHNEWPTINKFIDPPLAAHIMALEAWATNPDAYGPGIHPLPEEMDNWLVNTWRQHWPDEDLTAIAQELGLEE